jgi:hypothetical protein
MIYFQSTVKKRIKKLIMNYRMVITFSTCWYNFKSKFTQQIYLDWMDNMLSNVINYNLVVYSDKSSCNCILKYLSNPNIRLIIKEKEDFFGFKYKDDWIRNHALNECLRDRIDWTVVMLWCEKVHFVAETSAKKYFDTEYYGWCDIGYFRGTSKDMTMIELNMWPDIDKVNGLDKNCVHYAMMNNDESQIQYLSENINNRLISGLPVNAIPTDLPSICGGLFICSSIKIFWWKETFDNMLRTYFCTERIIKDDQMIIANCAFLDILRNHFKLYSEDYDFYNPKYDNWFMFQRILSPLENVISSEEKVDVNI